MGNGWWQRAGAWLAAGGLAGGTIAGCQPTTTSSADTPVRSDVTDIRPMARTTTATAAAAPTSAGSEPQLYDTSGLIPTAPQPITEPSAALASATVAPSAVVFGSTAAPVAPPAATAAKRRVGASARVRTHVVRSGETLFAIARSQYGDGAQWHRLAAANPTVASGSLRVGQQLIVP
jgi:5'-nucleotidase